MSLPLLHSPADIIRWLLIGLVQGSDPTMPGTWPVYAAGEPSSPDNVLTVYDTTPRDDGRSMIDGERFQHYGVQIRVRSTTHAIGYVKAKAIRTFLDESVYANVITIAGTPYEIYSISGTSILSLGKEVPQTKRTLFTINALAPIRRLT